MSISVSSFGDKILSFYHEGKLLWKGEMVAPRSVTLWPTMGCDLKCSFCYCKEENLHRQMADTVKVEKLLHEVATLGVESLEMIGGGEPTLHPDCFYFAKVAHSLGLKVGMITNGFKLDLSQSRYFDYIRIGMDAANEKEYMELKKTHPGRFTETIHRIRQLSEGRTGMRPRLGIKFTINQRNYLSLIEMVLIARDAKVDYCQFKVTQADDDALNKEQISIVEERIAYLKKQAPGFVLGSLLRHHPTMRCFMSPINSLILPNGDCPICCFFRKDKIIGNVFDEGFSVVWYGQRHKQLMETISMEDCRQFDCRWHYYNTEMHEIIVNGKHDISFI